jgi:hypothetical protein
VDRSRGAGQDGLPTEIQGVASEISLYRLKGLLRIPRWLRLRHRLRKLTNHLEREPRSPFRRDLALVEGLRITAERIERDMPAVVEARVGPYLCVKSYLESNKSWVFGPRCVFLLETKNWSPDTACHMAFPPSEGCADGTSSFI